MFYRSFKRFLEQEITRSLSILGATSAACVSRCADMLARTGVSGDRDICAGARDSATSGKHDT